jgi:SAM-dependent methyltransferase
MSTQYDAAVRIVVLLSCLVPWNGAVHAQSGASSKLSEQLAIQDSIYRLQGRQLPPGYTIDRSLFSYLDTLPAEFGAALSGLGPEERWLDIGAGQGRAILDYYTPERDMSDAEEQAWHERRASAVGISIEDRRTPRWRVTAKSLKAGKIRYLAGKRMREYAKEELGKFQVITDVGGGFTYTHQLSLFTEKALELLAENGTFYTVLQNVHAEDGSNQPFYRDSPFLTAIEGSDGAEVKICEWLKRISCVEVKCQFKKDWDPSVEVYRIRKTCGDVKVPPLSPVQYDPGTPPQRRFQLGETREARE